ncbi:hypothetical protein [Allosaccharopolyspora coralli]|nr:hypothetical protein [Allosaccharopolyspora coralli]
MTDWIWDLFANLARSALNGMLDMLGTTLLATPALDQVPVMGQVWGASRDIMIAVYALVVVIAGLVVMAYQTMQTRTTVREALPRLVVAFVAANLSLFLGGKAITFANALSQAVLGNRVGLDEATKAFTDTLRGGFPDEGSYGELYVIFTILALVVMLICVVLTYVVRITLTVILLAGAPLLLLCHALPQTEAIAFWWWKAFGAVLAIQIAQALTFAAAIRMFYLPGGVSLF